jgi:hypothetical protein
MILIAFLAFSTPAVLHQTYEEMLAELEEAQGDAALATQSSCRWACTHKPSRTVSSCRLCRPLWLVPLLTHALDVPLVPVSPATDV